MSSKVVGVLGGGQLARMLALAGLPMGMRFEFLDPSHTACAASLGGFAASEYDDLEVISRFARCVDVVTYEFENVPEETLRFVEQRIPVFPPVDALVIAGDRLKEKMLFKELGIPTPPFAAVASRAELAEAIESIGLPAILKTRALGYDGKGQFVLHRENDADSAWQNLKGAPSILERRVDFVREISLLAVRSQCGEISFYPLSENEHRNGVLHISHSRPDDAMEIPAQEHARRLLHRLDYVGLLALEFFQVGECLLANEMAPRVHNSGHWTIEGSVTSQFENHLRAGLGLPLGSTAPKGHAAMVNIIGPPPAPEEVLAVSGTRLHMYGKEFLPGRKTGHITLVASSEADLEANLGQLLHAMDRKEQRPQPIPGKTV